MLKSLVALATLATTAFASVAIIAFSDADCLSGNDAVANFTGTNSCTATPGGKSLSVVQPMNGCQIFIFSDSGCTSSDFVNIVNLSEKCHTGDAFNSVEIKCLSD